MKIIITTMDGTELDTRQVIESDSIVSVEVEGFTLTDEAGGLRVRSRDVLRITPAATNSIYIKNSRK